jgi:hypothetical protein
MYAGASYFGRSRLVFATGTSGVVSCHKDPKTKQPYRFVCAEEYQAMMRDDSIPEATGVLASSKMWATQ